MTESTSDVRVVNNTRDGRFEATVEGRLALAAYRRNGRTITFTHTEVPPELQGRGIAQRLAHEALELAKAEGLEVVPQCPFMRGYIERHPEYQSLVKGREA